jgi:hypothetical protein
MGEPDVFNRLLFGKVVGIGARLQPMDGGEPEQAIH